MTSATTIASMTATSYDNDSINDSNIGDNDGINDSINDIDINDISDINDSDNSDNKIDITNNNINFVCKSKRECG